MEKLKNFLETNKIAYSETTFGNNYFKNVKPLSFSGFSVTIEKYTSTIATMEKYLKKHRYTVISRHGFPGYQTLHICKMRNAVILKVYDDWTKTAVKACEETMHIYNNMGINCNDQLTGIMEFYGERVNAEIQCFNRR